jgi:anti-sigma factor RsiW
MKCKYFKLINRYFDGELDASLDKEVFTHLYQCTECRKQVELLKTVKGSVRRYEPLKADNNFTFRVMEEIENRFARGWLFNIKPVAVKLIPVLAVVLVVLSFVSFSGSGQFKKETVSLEEVLLANNFSSNERIVLNNEKLSEYDVFRLTLN